MLDRLGNATRNVLWVDIAVLALCAALPMCSLYGSPGALFADVYSEVPVKLWVFETFWREGVFGARIDAAGWPNAGSLNNADPIGTIVTAILRPILGRVGAYNVLIYGQLLANMLATRALLRTIVRSRWAAIHGAVAFALTPVVLMYCVAGAVTDMLNLWPWVLALRSGLMAMRTGWRDGLVAGLWVGLGFVTCPYNALVFSIVALPLLPFLNMLRARGPGSLPEPESAPWATVARALGAVVIGCVLIAGPYAVRMRQVMAADDSQMSDDMVAATRNVAPYTHLVPGDRDRYTAFLADYVAVGKDELLSREAGSRYYRAFSPGLSLIALGLLGLTLQRRRMPVLMWWGVGLFCAFASLGPFTPIAARWASSTPNNLVWLGLLRFWPGTTLLQEPFRYAIPAALGLVVAAAFGIEAIERRVGAWIGPAALIVWLAEGIWLSPVPIPMPIAPLTISRASVELDTLLPPGAIISLPYFDLGTDRFQRIHFLDQLIHRRPIADEVIGFPARYLKQNNYTAALLQAEKPYGRLKVEVADPALIETDRARLVADGFVGIVIDKAHFENQMRYRAVRELLTVWGEPTSIANQDVYRLK